MHINWLGQTCVKLQTKNLKDEDVVILIDAYKPKTGDFPRSFSPDLALFSMGLNEAVTLSQDPFILDSYGEVEKKDVMVYSFPGDKNSKVFKIGAEGMNIVHLGNITQKPNAEIMGKISSPDILLIPVGGDGKTLLDPQTAGDLVTALEPRIIIPIAHNCDTDPKAKPITDFIKEIGLKPEATEKKIIIKKRDLPEEETRLIILEKNY
jgi:hypothetical protein